MRILVCVSEYPPGVSSGIGNMTYAMVKEFEKKGHACTICSPIGPDIKLGSEKLIQKAGGIGLLYFWAQVNHYFKNNSIEYDTVWLHWPLFITKSQFPKAVATFHGTYKGFRNMATTLPLKVFYSLMQISESYCLKNLSGKVTVVSPRITEELTCRGVAIDSIQYIPPGVNTSRFYLISSYKSGYPTFIYVGRLEQPKNLFKMVDTFAEVKKAVVSSRLLIVGSGSLKESLETYVMKKGISGIRLLGFVQNEYLPKLFSTADFFLLASVYEGQPIALVEGMASGLPPIVNDIPSLRYLVNNSNTGLVVDFDKPVEASKNIVDYITSVKSQEDKQIVVDYIRDNMSLEVCVDKYLEVLGE